MRGIVDSKVIHQPPHHLLLVENCEDLLSHPGVILGHTKYVHNKHLVLLT